MKKYLSPHSINLYLECPRAFYYYFNEYQELTPPPYLREAIEFGNIVHKIISKYYQYISLSSSTISDETITEYLRKAYREVVSSSPERLLEKVLQNFRNFEKWRISSNIFFIKPECVECEYIREDLGIHGIVDVVFKKKKNNKLVVVDWKTGEYTFAFEPNIRLQLSIYAYLVGTDEAYVVNLLEDSVPERVELINLNEILWIVDTIRSDTIFIKRVDKEKKNDKEKKIDVCKLCSFQIPCFEPSILRSRFYE